MSVHAVEPTAIPRVSGRHRDRALARARKARAIELRLQGLTYKQIADEMGYANQGSVYSIIKSAQQAEIGDRARERRELEEQRLDALQLAAWPKAMAGDVDAIALCTRIVMERARLLGLIPERGGRRGELTCTQPQTVVLMEDDCRLSACPEHAGM